MNYLKLILAFSFLTFAQAYRLRLNRNYQYYNGFETIDLSGTKSYLSGAWFKYQPIIGIFQVGLISQSKSNSSLLFYRTVNEELFSLSFITINYDQKLILLQSRIKCANKNLISNLILDPNSFDGIWIYHYYYFIKTRDSYKIIIGYINAKTNQQQVFDEIQLIEKQTFKIIFGGGLNKYDDQFNEQFYLTYFLGILEVEIGMNMDVDPSQIFQNESYDEQTSLFSQMVVEDSSFDSISFMQVDSNYNIEKNYKINFWFKVHNSSDANILHISGIIASDFKNKIGGNVAYIHYEQKSIIFGYYSYDFPYFGSTTDIFRKQQLIDYSIIEQEWYMIAIQYYEDILYFFIVNSASDRKYLNQWSDINQFTNPMFYMYIGGDLYQKSITSGQISLLVLETDFQYNQLQKIQCHYSCLTCNGPYSTNCLTCLDESGREFIAGKCQCKFEYLEINQLQCQDFRQYTLIETQKNSNEILCQYGYFLYNDECFPCPSAAQEIYIFCTECIINWRKWVYQPVCTLTMQSNQDLNGTYLKNSTLLIYFTFNEGQLVLCNNCYLCLDTNLMNYCDLYKLPHLSQPVYIQCLSQTQYSLITLECEVNKYQLTFKPFICQQYCGDCDNYGKCFYCQDPSKYYLTADQTHCIECQIKFCKYCFETNIYNQFDIQQSSLIYNAGFEYNKFITEDMITYCALCNQGYTFNIQSGQCEQIKLPENCLQAYVQDSQFVCIVSISNNFDNHQISITNCLQYMTNCLECIHNIDQRLFCLKCISGYYLDTNLGICKSCYDYFDSKLVKECQLINYFFQDQWMIDIQPFYNSFFTGQHIYLSYAALRSYINIIECQPDYLLFNTQCYQAKTSDTCLQAGYAQNQYYCQICKRNKEQFSYSYDPNNLIECLTCPYLCKYCQSRQQIDILQINQAFTSDQSLANYCIKSYNNVAQTTSSEINKTQIYFDTQYMFLTICQIYKECQLTIKFVSQVYLKIPSIFDYNLIKYMNMRKITQLIGVFNYTQQRIENLDMRYLQTFKTKVFSITKITSHLIGQKSIFFFSEGYLKEIDELIFEQTTVTIFLNVNYKNYITFNMSSGFGSRLKMNESIFTISQDQPLFNKNVAPIFQIYNLHSMIFDNSIFIDMFLQYDFALFESNYEDSEIIIQNTLFKNITFDNSTLLSFKSSNQVSRFIMKNVSFINCTFLQNSGFIKFDQNFLYKETIIIQDLTIINSIFQGNNYFISFPISKEIILINTYLFENILIYSSFFSFAECKNLTIINFNIKSTSFHSSHLISILGNVYLNLNFIELAKIQIRKFTPIIYMLNSEKSNVSISNLQQFQITLSQNEVQNYQNYCLYLLSGNNINMISINIEKSSFLKDFCLIYFANVNIRNVNIYGSKNIENILSPIINCLDLQFYHSSLFQIENFKNIYISNLTSENLLLINNSLLYFVNLLTSSDQEITLNNLILQRNLILKLGVNFVSTLIYIHSNYKLNVNFLNQRIENNWINHYQTDFEIISPGLIYVAANSINLRSSQFHSNLITNSSESLIYFNSILLRIDNVTNDNSIIPLSYFYNSLKSDQINNLFPFESQGGIFSINCQHLYFTNSIISNQIASIGGALFIIVQLEGFILFQNNQFINTTAKSKTLLQGIGGCIYLDSSKSSLIFNFINNTILSSNSKYAGGTILIQPSKVFNQIKISNLVSSNIHSLKGSLLFCQFPDESLNNTVIIQNVTINIDENSFKQFLLNQQFSDYDDQFWSASISTGMINIINSAVYISQLTFSGELYQPILYLIFSQKLILSQINFINVQSFSSQLINLSSYNEVSEKAQDFQIEKILIQNVIVQIVSDNNCKPQPNQQLIYPLCQIFQVIIKLDYLSDEDIECIIQSKQKLINRNTKPVFAISNLQTANQNKIKSVRIQFVQCQTCDQGIFMIFNSNFKIQHFFMNNNQCGFLGCMTIVQNQSQSMSVSISTSMFYNNSAQLGGAIYIKNVDLYLHHTKFLYNQATFGGGIYYQSNGNKMITTKTLVFDNQAEISGGGIMMLNYSISNLTFQSLNIQNNLAKNGVNNLYSKIAYLKLHIYGSLSINENINENLDFAKIDAKNYFFIPSGQQLSTYEKYDNKLKTFSTISINPKLFAYNQLGEQLYGIEGSQCYIYQKIGNLQQFISDQTSEFFSVQFNNSYFDLSNMTITFNPYEENNNLTIQISAKCTNQTNDNYTLYFYFKTFFCQPGEYISNNACLKCDSSKGQYSVKANQTECQKINTASIKAITSSQLNLNIGYWRQHQEISIPVLCYKAKENCLGGWGTGDSSCLIGNIGGLCEECDIYNLRGDGQFQKQFGQSCLKCGKILGMILKILFITFWTLGSIWVTVQSTNNSNDQLKRLKMVTKYYEIIFKQNLDKAGSLIKMLTNYCQIILALQTFQLSLIVDIPNFISPISDPTGSFSYSFDCYLSINSQISIIYGRIIWMLCLTFAYLFIYILIYIIHSCFSQQSIKKSTITTSILYLFTYTQPNLINELVSLVAVKTISGIDYIKANLSYKYFTAEHYQWAIFMILPLIILYALVIPGLIFLKLKMNQKNLNTKKLRETLGYMYYEYQNSNYYWEIIKIIQRVFIIVILNYLDSDVTVKAILICFIVFTYHKLISYMSPYCLTYLNNFEKNHIFSCAIIIMLGNLLYQVQSYNNATILIILQFIIFMLIIHIFFNVIREICTSYSIKYYEKVDFMKKMIVEKFPKISETCPQLATKLKSQKMIKLQNLYRYKKIKNYLRRQVSLRKSFEESQKNILIKETEGIQQSQLMTQQVHQFDGQIQLIIQHRPSEFSNSPNHKSDGHQLISVRGSMDPFLNTQSNVHQLKKSL